MRRKLPNHVPSTWAFMTKKCEIGVYMYLNRSRNLVEVSIWIKKKTNRIGKDSECIDFASVNKRRRTTPPPPSTGEEKNALYIQGNLEIVAKISHNFGENINKQSAQKRLRMHHLHPFFNPPPPQKKNIGETRETPKPPPPTTMRG